jgi:hypothetical protein
LQRISIPILAKKGRPPRSDPRDFVFKFPTLAFDGISVNSPRIPAFMTSSKQLIIAGFLLGMMETNADIILYSSSFGGSSATNLQGQAVVTSGATSSEHIHYGTSASATWSANTRFKADGSTAGASGTSATLGFTPQNGHVYNLTVTTSFVQLATASFHAMGYFKTSGFTGNINSATGSQVWALTRPGDASFDNQEIGRAHV